jgi:DNA-directed RNA polymerase subunit M/transcription elongation factor TFIIS
MEFCDKCGKPLIMVDNTAICYCGFRKKASKISASEKIPEPTKKGEGAAEKNKSDKGFPHKCNKCGYEFAEVTDLGVFYSDESSIYLFKCKKCENTERDAYGSSNA